MRYFEITSGVRVPTSLEEQEILDKAVQEIAKKELDDREREVARRMVSRGLLKRFTRSGKIYFKKNKDKVWRS